MKSLCIAILSTFLLSSCAFYAGLKDKSAPIPPSPTNKQNTVEAPPSATENPAASTQNKATSNAAKMMSPITQ